MNYLYFLQKEIFLETITLSVQNFYSGEIYLFQFQYHQTLKFPYDAPLFSVKFKFLFGLWINFC